MLAEDGQLLYLEFRGTCCGRGDDQHCHVGYSHIHDVPPCRSHCVSHPGKTEGQAGENC
ncbi:hypothetical protein DPMN_084505, partial [Dreissena polymorpha]